METVNRGGSTMQITKHCAFGVPPIVIGHNMDDVSRQTKTAKLYFLPSGRMGSAG